MKAGGFVFRFVLPIQPEVGSLRPRRQAAKEGEGKHPVLRREE
jgi:hypothetical protein